MIAILVFSPVTPVFCHAFAAPTKGTEYELLTFFGAIGYTCATPWIAFNAAKLCTSVLTATPAARLCVLYSTLLPDGSAAITLACADLIRVHWAAAADLAAAVPLP